MISVSKIRPGIAATFAGALLLGFVTYALALSQFFPGYFSPWIPVHRDTYDHFAIGLSSWLTVASGLRPVSWAVMKLASGFGILGLTSALVAIVLCGITSYAVAVSRAISADAPRLLAVVPIYFVLLFCHPEFYIKHRDDFELGVSFLLLSVSLCSWLGWEASGRKSWLIVFALCTLAWPLAKETYAVAGPVLFVALAAARRFSRQSAFAALFVVLAVAVDVAILFSRHSFLNLGGDSYEVSFDLRDDAARLFAYLRIAVTWPSVLAVVFGLACLRANRPAVTFAVGSIVAGIASYIPNAMLPNHFIEWYAWDGLPFLLAPVLGLASRGTIGIEETDDRAADRHGFLALLATGFALGFLALPIYRFGFGDLASRTVAAELVDERVLTALPRIAAVPDGSKIAIAGLADGSLTPWQSDAFVRREFGRRSFDVLTDAKANGDAIVGRAPEYVVAFDADGSLRAVSTVDRPTDLPRQLVLATSDADRDVVARDPKTADDRHREESVFGRYGFWRRVASLAAVSHSDAIDREWANRARQAADAVRATASDDVVRFDADRAVASAGGDGLAQTTLHWTTESERVDIRVSSANGLLFSSGGASGSAQTGRWVTDGMKFYLQEFRGGQPFGEPHVITVRVTR